MENKVLLTLSEFRVIHLTPEGFFKLLFGLFSLLLLNSCSKEATLDEVRPSSVETISELKTWATKNDKLNQANLIEWNNSIPIMLPDSIKGYAAPVKTASGYKEFITFELGGKRHGWYKSYNRLNSTDMQIVIQTAEGKTLRSGFIRKKSASTPKGKATPMREMNFDTPIDWMLIEEILGILLENVTISAPRLNQGGGGFYFGNTRFDMNTFNYYFEAGYFNAGNYGGGNSQYGFVDYNITEFEDKFTNPCFSKVLADLRAHNFYGEIGDIINKFIVNPKIKLNFTQENSLKDLITQKPLLGLYDPNTKTIKLSESLLSSSSQEFIASVLIHEVLHANIGKTEDLDHVTMLEKYVKPAGEYLNKIYNIDKTSAENLFIAGLKNANNYVTVTGGFVTRRYTDIDLAIDIYRFNKSTLGHYCN
ncbi:hypothetical protein [Aquirufa antheringensis]|uniref:hypothetical protein n=1 Tax=Aquirufa antheringensis TaxID=2516559 RepID=UPI0010327F77|nr:hypothetical protein [Aquirufa antheringensis]TBH71471.1 hypothetical protein EWU21_04035 [Aquirufa antheringensis]